MKNTKVILILLTSYVVIALVSLLAFCGFGPHEHLGQCLKLMENWRPALLWPMTGLVIAFSHLFSGLVMIVVLVGVVYWLRKTTRVRKV